MQRTCMRLHLSCWQTGALGGQAEQRGCMRPAGPGVAHLQVGCGADAGQLPAERGHAGGGRVPQQLLQHEVQQGGAPVGALHIR